MIDEMFLYFHYLYKILPWDGSGVNSRYNNNDNNNSKLDELEDETKGQKGLFLLPLEVIHIFKFPCNPQRSQL